MTIHGTPVHVHAHNAQKFLTQADMLIGSLIADGIERETAIQETMLDEVIDALLDAMTEATWARRNFRRLLDQENPVNVDHRPAG